MMKSLKLKGEERGQALVEFTLILPVLLLLILGVIEFGWLLNGKITLTAATREGARTASILLKTDTERTTKVLAAVEATSDLSGLTIDTGSCSVTDDGENVVVTIQAEMDPIIGIYVSDSVTMKSKAVIRRE